MAHCACVGGAGAAADASAAGRVPPATTGNAGVGDSAGTPTTPLIAAATPMPVNIDQTAIAPPADSVSSVTSGHHARSAPWMRAARTRGARVAPRPVLYVR